jgi:hypothetical protein
MDYPGAEYRAAASRAWREVAALRADLPQRGERARRLGSGAALATLSRRSPDGKLHVHTAMDALGAMRAIEARGRRAAV